MPGLGPGVETPPSFPTREFLLWCGGRGASQLRFRARASLFLRCDFCKTSCRTYRWTWVKRIARASSVSARISWRKELARTVEVQPRGPVHVARERW